MSSRTQQSENVVHWYINEGDGALSSRRWNPACSARRPTLIGDKADLKAKAPKGVEKCTDCVDIYNESEKVKSR